MNITNRFEKSNTTSEAAYRLVKPDGSCEDRRDTVIHEHFMEISVNCIPVLRLSCTSMYINELIIGRLYTEGIIDDVNEIERLFVCGEGSLAEVTLCKPIAASDPFTFPSAEPSVPSSTSAPDTTTEKTVTEIKNIENGSANTVHTPALTTEPTCCTGNKILTSIEGRRQMKPLPSICPDNKAVFTLAGRFTKDSGLHKTTSGTHSCYLYIPDGGTPEDGNILEFEDISRHNAVDKAVGYALLNGTDLSRCMIYTTGRIPEDMARKAIMAGIPVLISKSVPTDAAIKLAGEYGLTLIYNAWPDSYRIATSHQ